MLAIFNFFASVPGGLLIAAIIVWAIISHRNAVASRKAKAEQYPRTIVAAPYIWRGNQKGGHN